MKISPSPIWFSLFKLQGWVPPPSMNLLSAVHGDP
jgi:hypothetical protein